jgi:hypothetical protein
VRNCLTDEGRPLGTGLREQVPNHLRRLCAEGKVANAEGKGLELLGQVTGKKRTAREPLLKCRNEIRRCPKPQPCNYCGISSDDTCLRAERHPAREVA